MDLWIPITIFAAFSQNVRSALQKHLKGQIGTTGATFIRFGYGLPFAAVYVAVLHAIFGMDLPTPNLTFAGGVIVGGIAQILATFLLVSLFSFKNFTVGTAYSKTEPILAAAFGWLFLGELVGPLPGLAIVIGVVGVIVISLARRKLEAQSIRAALLGKPALIGLASAAFFGLSAASYRMASLSLDGDLFMRAGFALVCATLFQTAVMGIWMAFRARDELHRSLTTWRTSLWVGFAGVAGSIGWFTAMTLQQVAYVRALAQIELVFTLAASVLLFREKILPAEVLGCVLIAGSVAVLVLSI